MARRKKSKQNREGAIVLVAVGGFVALIALLSRTAKAEPEPEPEPPIQRAHATIVNIRLL